MVSVFCVIILQCSDGYSPNLVDVCNFVSHLAGIWAVQERFASV